MEDLAQDLSSSIKSAGSSNPNSLPWDFSLHLSLLLQILVSIRVLSFESKARASCVIISDFDDATFLAADTKGAMIGRINVASSQDRSTIYSRIIQM